MTSQIALSKQSNIRLILMSLLIRSEPALKSFYTIAFAIIMLLPLEWFRLFKNGFFYSDLRFSTELIICAALIVGFFSQALYFILRTMCALLLRADAWFPRVIPGIAVFLVIQSPIQALVSAGGPQFPPAIAWAVGLLFGIVLGLPLLLVFPDLKGENGPYFLSAALLSKVILEWSDFIPFPEEQIARYALLTFIHASLLLILYLLLQSRRRLHRSPYYSPFLTSAFQRVTLAIALALMYTGAIINSISNFAMPDFLILVCVVCLAAWQISAYHLATSIEQRDRRVRWSAALLLTTVSIAAALDLFLFYPAQTETVSPRFLEAGSVSGRILLNAGSFFDADGDGNSVWPGGDPDDRDPCYRIDASALCRDYPAREISGPVAAKIFIHTSMGALPDRSEEEQENVVYLASNRADEALAASLRGVGGYEARTPSLFSMLTDNGFRTICGADTFIKPGAGFNLDHGCQVFLPGVKFDEFRTEEKRYAESKTLVWYHGSPLSIPQIAELEARGYVLLRIFLDLRNQTATVRSRKAYPGHHLSEVMKLFLGFDGDSNFLDVHNVNDIPLMDRFRKKKFPYRYLIHYEQKPGDVVHRILFEGYTGARWISEPGERPDL